MVALQTAPSLDGQPLIDNLWDSIQGILYSECSLLGCSTVAVYACKALTKITQELFHMYSFPDSMDCIVSALVCLPSHLLIREILSFYFTKEEMSLRGKHSSMPGWTQLSPFLFPLTSLRLSQDRTTQKCQILCPVLFSTTFGLFQRS